MSLADRFWSKVDRRGPDECWPWTGATNEHGYGVLHADGRHGSTVKAHRVAMQLAGEDINGRSVLHSCDNPPCCNRAHLRLGTQAENMADMRARGRSNAGEANGQSKLTAEAAAAIRDARSRGLPVADLAVAYGISKGAVSMIANGKRWPQ